MIVVPASSSAAPLPQSTAIASGAQANPAEPHFKPDRKKAKQAYDEGLAAERSQNWQAAYDSYVRAVEWAPSERPYVLRRDLARGRLIQTKVDLAEKDAVSGRLADARKELLAAYELDPSDQIIRDRLAELAALEPTYFKPVKRGMQLASEIPLHYQPGARNFNFRGDTEDLYDEIARQFGVNAAFDAELHSRQTRFQVNNVDFLTAMDLAGAATQTFWHALNGKLFFVADDTPQKRREYEPLLVRTIQLPASETPEQVTELARLIRDITGILRVQEDPAARTLTLRANARAMGVAAELIANLEKPAGELVLEMEILEVDRAYARQIGITPPQSAKVYAIDSSLLGAGNSQEQIISTLEQIFGTPSALSGLTPSQIAGEIASGQLNLNSVLPPLVAFGGGATTFFSTLPGATASLSKTLSLVRSGRRILLLAQDNQPATFFVGERFPVTLAQYSSSLTSSLSTAGITSENFPISTLTTGNAPSFVTAASLRNNGIQDLIVANHADNDISVYLGNGDGTFAAPVTYPTGLGPVWIATGDFNNDGATDLAVVDKGANTVSILLGNGDGTFSPLTGISSLLAAGRAPTALALGDFDGAKYANGNPILDLVVANQNDNTVSLFLGNGNGTFRARTDYATGASPVYVATGDFNGDGILDVATANFMDNTVSILLGQAAPNGTAAGTLASRVDYTAGAGPTSIAVGDYNRDGISDLAVTDSTSNALAILFGGFGGTFNTPYQLSVGTDPLSVVTADFDGNGTPDGAVANNASNTVSVILNKSSSSSPTSSAPGNLFPYSQYVDLGLKIKATPHLRPDHQVTLKLRLDLTGLAGQSFNSIPVLTNDSFEQTVRLNENQTSLLAGILQPSVSTTLNGIPGVAELPLGDVLGGNKAVQQGDRELLILITPRVVRFAQRKDVTIYAGHGTSGGLGGYMQPTQPGFRLPQPFPPQRPPQPPTQPPRPQNQPQP